MFYFDKFLMFFIQGLVFGVGPCLFSCGILLLPYVAGLKRGFLDGLKVTAIFSLSRMLVYIIFSSLSGYVGYYIFNIFTNRTYLLVVWFFMSLFILMVGFLLIFDKNMDFKPCVMLNRYFGSGITGFIFLGFLVGISPCFPMLAILMEIAILSEKIFFGALYGFAFGLGTFFSPILLLGALSSGIPKIFIKDSKFEKVFRIICGFLLLFVGIYLLLSRVLK